MNERSLREALRGLPVPDIRYFDVIGSTNDHALAWAANGARDGSLVVADVQTAGRGRSGRRWITIPGGGLAFSLIILPTAKEQQYFSFFSPLGALGISQALIEGYQLPAMIKYPNDILLNRRKTAGILVEASWLGDKPQCVIIGIGLNVAPISVPPQEQLLFPATCIETVLGQPVDRWQLLAKIIRGITYWRARLDSAEFVQTWHDRLAFKGEMVTVQPDHQKPALYGKIIGIDQNGSLLLQSKNGIQTVIIGDVLLRPLEGNSSAALGGLNGEEKP